MSTWKERFKTLEDEEKYWRGKYLGGSRLDDIFDVLRTGEYAAGGYLLRQRQLKEYVDAERAAGRQPTARGVYGRIAGSVTEGLMYGVKHRISPSTVLEVEGFWPSLAVDIAYDPTTYTGFGLWKLAKGAKKAIPEVAAKVGVGPTVTGIGHVLGEAFVPGYWMKKLPGKHAEYFDDYLDWVLQKRGAAEQAFHELKVMAKPHKRSGAAITKYIESGIDTGDKALNKYIDDVIKPHVVSMREAELAKGIDVGEVAGYVHHAITEEGEKFVKQMGGMPEVWKYYAQKVRTPYAKERTLEGTIEEINKEFGFKFFEDDFWKATAKRTQKHVADIYTADWFRHVQEKYGVEAPILSVKKVLRGYEKPPKVSEYLQKKITELGEDFPISLEDIPLVRYQKEIVTRATSLTEEGIDFVESAHPQIKRLLPDPIAKHLEEIVEEPAQGFMPALGHKHDVAMTWWKRAVTVGFGVAIHPAFFARNVYSGIYQNWLRTGMWKPADYYRGIQARLGRGIFETAERGKISGAEMQDILREQSVMGQPGMMDVMLEDVWERNLYEKIRDVPSWFMTETENLVRIPEFVKLAKTKSLQEARDTVYETHFAYLPEFHTKFEMQYAKRAFPFWTWMSRDIPFQIKQTLKHPSKLGGVGKVQQQLIEKYGMEEEYERRNEWQQNMFLIPNIFKRGEDKGWIGLGMPFLDLTTDLGDLYFAVSPLKLIPELGYIEQDWGSREYRTGKQKRAIRRLAEGRYGTTARRLARTEDDLDKAMYLAGMPTYEAAPEDIKTAFEAAQWQEPHATKEQKYAAWVAAGAPEGFKIKTLTAPPGGMVGMAAAAPKPKWYEVWKKQPEPLEEPKFELLALTEELYEASKGFKPTEKQLQYILTGLKTSFPELSVLESPMQTVLGDALRRAYELPGSREARYEELVAEWRVFKAGEMQLEYPTEEQRMESWRRAGEPEKYIQKVYRDELGKLLGVATFTPEELEAMGTWTPSETEARRAFRDMGKMRPKERFRILAQEHKEELLKEEALKEELTELQRGIVRNKYEYTQIPIGSTGERVRRSRELEEMLGTGVDR